MRNFLTLAALSGFLAVGFGAFGAHGVSDPKAAEWLRTGAQYQMIHALAVFACAVVGGRMRWAPALFLVGSALFAGSLYAMALGGPRILGAVTPLGGLCFLAGWLLLARAAWKTAR
ncbi:MAG: hypothetical protein BGN86_11170 [Caulobacterales bacterium 68-7]|nr:DUF423 domain-containing protein [Caulobacterales bacterium]OJU13600.1 MAG: hypothetical protein BGN86_11170 [Caulobacterales bacterium 68-7]